MQTDIGLTWQQLIDSYHGKVAQELTKQFSADLQLNEWWKNWQSLHINAGAFHLHCCTLGCVQFGVV
jgi:hypothetical protein